MPVELKQIKYTRDYESKMRKAHKNMLHSEKINLGFVIVLNIFTDIETKFSCIYTQLGYISLPASRY